MSKAVVLTDIDAFATVPHTALEYAELKLSGYPISKRRMIEKLERECVPSYPAQRRGGGYVYWFKDLPENWQKDIVAHFSSRTKISFSKIDKKLYEAAPSFNRKKADKYIALYNEFHHLRGKQLIAAIEKYNQEHPEQRSSYKSLKAIFKQYEECGISAFIGKHGQRKNKTSVPDDAFDFWKSLVMTEGAPSFEYCWKITVSRFCSTKENISTFPACDAFLRRLRTKYSESQIFLYRYGYKKWSQKYAYYIDRDPSKVQAGRVWVCDHAQIDDLVISSKSRAKREKVLAPWYTGWRDFRTGKHLAWDLYEDSPNSDHILQTFYHAALEFGLPDIIYVDNGRDFRSKDVTGGRKSSKLNTERARATMGLLGIKVIFAIPYSPQSKLIERDFRKIKEWFSKMLPGYRGGNILERPEKLKGEIKSGKLLSFEEFKPLLDRFVSEVLNKMPGKGKALKGQSPDDLWNSENPVPRTADKDSLMLCCMRTSKSMVIGRHGIRDSEFGVVYFDEWLFKHPREKVYIRRDPRDFNEAWVFRAETDEYLGKAFIRKPVAAIAETPIEKEALKQALSIRWRQLKLEKEPGSTIVRQSTEVILESMMNAAKLFGNNVPAQNQNVRQLAKTPLDRIAIEDREAKRTMKYKNDHEERILTALWHTDASGRKVKPILKLDSDFDYFAEHEEELRSLVNG